MNTSMFFTLRTKIRSCDCDAGAWQVLSQLDEKFNQIQMWPIADISTILDVAMTALPEVKVSTLIGGMSVIDDTVKLT